MGCARSPFRDSESYLGIIVELAGDDFQLILKQNNSISVFNGLSPGIYTIIDFSEVVNTMSDHEGTLKIENDDIKMKT